MTYSLVASLDIVMPVILPLPSGSGLVKTGSTTCSSDPVQQRQELLSFAEARWKYLWTWLSFSSDCSDLPFTAAEGALGSTQGSGEG